ncbi:MAG: hypothetical protein JXB85_04295 [Anaerolineales bacterium]|nr:hypothetical protein [Anaerolineales bacterium]
MPDLISLTCPSCGGKLKVSKNASSLTCQHCGNDHLVKREADGGVMLEAYARCPVCGRNDKSEKVSAILAIQTQEISGVEQKQQIVTAPDGRQKVVVHDVPFSRKQVTRLGQQLVPPAPPDPRRFPPLPRPPSPPSRGGGVAVLVIGIVLLLSSVCCILASIPSFAASLEYYYDSSPLILGMASVVTGAILFLVGGGLVGLGIFMTIRAGKPNPEARVRYQQQVLAVQQEHKRIRQSYAQTMDRWDQLYYCTRDDCVFIPGKNTWAPVSRMKSYLLSPDPIPPPS